MSGLRFLIDVNVGTAVVDSLRTSDHDVVFAGDLDRCMSDTDILTLAHSEQRIVVTLDNDFGELAYRAGQSHSGVLLLRMPGARRQAKVEVVQEIVSRYGHLLSGNFCVYKQGKLRIRRSGQLA
jgi:predicted nuclease of predicted toxin-antitoxin system